MAAVFVRLVAIPRPGFNPGVAGRLDMLTSHQVCGVFLSVRTLIQGLIRDFATSSGSLGNIEAMASDHGRCLKMRPT
jgi:hypothetical protein